MDEEISVQHQASFAQDGDVVVEGSTETSLDQFGVNVDERSRNTRLDQPEASEFGIDDRPVQSSSRGSRDQVPLVRTVDEQQNTLDGTGPTSRFETNSSG